MRRSGRPLSPLEAALTRDKRTRHSTILELIARHEIASQEKLKNLLAERGWDVAQATLSRDLREMGVVRAAGEDGARYMLPQMVAEEAKPSLGELLPQWFSRIDGVRELLVLHTLPSGAQPIAEALDSQAWPDVLGTIAGENTVLIICRSPEARENVSSRLVAIASAG
jgi:transcriptional regulator of arginine metabolism